jgi:TolA-binding protein
MKTIFVSTAVLLFAAAPLAAAAQDRTIEGRAIPQEKAGAIEDRCAELLTLQGDTGTQTPETALAETTENQSNQQANGSANGEIDISAITLEQCQEGGFLPE